jgi:putative toxin-antitoxin system antitoxin component (TIGR02293 family)
MPGSHPSPQTEAQTVLALLGGKKALGTVPHDERDYIALVREGLPFKALESAAEALTLSWTELEKTLHLSSRTLRRRKESRLSLIESERVLRIVRVVARAQTVLGDLPKALDWLGSPNRALDGERPLGMLDTDLGTDQVLQVLGRIEFNVYD